MTIQPVILAAGQGTRMKSSLPKVLHPIIEKPMIRYVLDAVRSVTEVKPVVVVGHGAEQVERAIADEAITAIQDQQLGTANAVQAAESAAKGQASLTLVAYGDMPCLTAETIANICETQRKNPESAFSMLTILLDDSHGFGRIIRKADGSVFAIVEEAQATPAQLQIKECNVGLYCFRSDWLWNSLKRIKLSPKGEYYLTDLVELANEDGLKVQATLLDDRDEALGVNNRVHLAEAETILRRRINHRWMMSGVTMIDPEATYVGHDVVIEPDVVIYPNTHLIGTSMIRKGSLIGPLTFVENCQIGTECTLPQCVVRNTDLPDHTDLLPGQTLDGSAAI